MHITSNTRRRKVANNWPLFLLGWGALAAAEAFAAFGILQVNKATLSLFGHTIRLGYVEIAITFSLAMLSFWVSTVSAQMANDPRPEQRKRAPAAAALSLALLSVPFVYLASGFAIPRQEAERTAYIGSAAMEADQAIIADPQADSRVKLEARENLKKAAPIAKAEPGLGEFIKAALIHFAIWLTGSLAMLAPPETDAQRRDRVEAAEKARRKAEREARKAQKAKEARKPGNVFELKEWLRRSA